MQRHKLRRGYRDNRTAFGVPGETGNSVRALLKLSGLIDAINVQIGRWFAWAILLAVAVSAINAVVRKTFDMSSNAWLELQWVLFSVVFLLCASWTLRENEHIRIDIVNNLLPHWPTKSLVMIAFALLLAQGISELIKRVAIMRSMIPDPHATQPSALETEAEQLIEAMGIEKK